MTEQRRRRLSGFFRVYAVFGAAILILLIMDGGGVFTSRLLEDRVQWQTHTYQVIDQAEAVRAELRSLEAAHRGFVLLGSGNFISEYGAARTALDSAMQNL